MKCTYCGNRYRRPKVLHLRWEVGTHTFCSGEHYELHLKAEMFNDVEMHHRLAEYAQGH